ncbi:MAG: methyltransferase domain-containing protein [Lachnospiraceae bacterium]|nr:methyltransferase domain-containing protein [Lachnospiraceae bacterium]
MVNKVHFGKRIASLRRKAGLSQSELAEQFGVTSQAVSKWECENAVPDIDLLLELSHFYHVTINEMLEDVDLLYHLTGRVTGENGVSLFVSESEDTERSDWAHAMVKEKWIKRNWEYAQSNTDFDTGSRDAVGKAIASNDGIILETGAGPGGGYMPYILKYNSDARIIISDFSPTVVSEWKAFLDIEMNSPNLYYAAFDFCSMPFKDNCIDIVSDGGGIGNCIGEKSKALKEAYRVLKPGGMLITSTGFVNRETLAEFSSDVQRALLERRPDVFEDLYEDTVLAGFHKIDSVISGCWYTDDDESDIADLARSLGVNLKFTSYVRYCTKEKT